MNMHEAYQELSSKHWTDKQLQERLDEVCQQLNRALDMGNFGHAGNLKVARRRLLREESRRRALRPLSEI